MMNLVVRVYDGSKYKKESKKLNETVYKDVKNGQVIIMADKEIYEMGFDEVDPYGEYFKITLNNGETATFRNSFVDVFVE